MSDTELDNELLAALKALTKHSEQVNYAFYVEGRAKAMQAAMAGQKELLQLARAAIAKAAAAASQPDVYDPQDGDIVVNHLGESPQVVGSSNMPTDIAKQLVRDGHAKVLWCPDAGGAE